MDAAGEINAALIRGFYEAFAERDHATMAAAYAPEATFEDPAFGKLHGAEIGAMWRMLCEAATDLEIAYRDLSADAGRGSAHWDADYTFTRTGRQVHNSIDAEFSFADGLIASHRDRFNFWRWSRQALGPVGLALGWTPLLRALFRRQARAQLAKFIEESGASAN